MPTIEYIQGSLPLQLLLVVAASFLIGLSMEGRKAEGKRFSPGGVRTFPLICLAGFLLGMLDGPVGPAFVAGLVVLGAWMGLLYWAKVAAGNYGMTTEVYALVTYVTGGVAAAGLWWLLGALTVLLVVLQELKGPLEKLARRLPGDELVTLSKFVLLTAVILPLMPDAGYTRYALNPQRIWLVVVAVAAVSYVSYILQRFAGVGRHGVLLTGLLGGAYSSTVTTVVLARRAAALTGQPSPADARRPASSTQNRAAAVGYAAAILAAAGVMHFRLLVLLGIFDPALTAALLWPLGAAGLAGAGLGVGLCLLSARRGPAQAENGHAEDRPTQPQDDEAPPAPSPELEGPVTPSPGSEELAPSGPAPISQGRARPHPGPPAAVAGASGSPLEMKTALAFAGVFVALLVVTHEADRLLGAGGLLGLAAISGLGVVDPFVLGLTQSRAPGAGAAALAVIVAVSANHLAKGAYAALLTARRRPAPPGEALARGSRLNAAVPTEVGTTPPRPPDRSGAHRPVGRSNRQRVAAKRDGSRDFLPRPAARTGLLALWLLTALSAATLAAWLLSVRLNLMPFP